MSENELNVVLERNKAAPEVDRAGMMDTWWYCGNPKWTLRSLREVLTFTLRDIDRFCEIAKAKLQAWLPDPPEFYRRIDKMDIYYEKPKDCFFRVGDERPLSRDQVYAILASHKQDKVK